MHLYEGEVSDVVVEQDVDGNKGAEITKKVRDCAYFDRCVYWKQVPWQPLESRKRKSVEEEIFSKKDRRGKVESFLLTLETTPRFELSVWVFWLWSW